DGAGACQDNDEPDGTDCGDAATECSGQDTCDGAGGCQDNDDPNGSPCDDGQFCNGADSCLDGGCDDHEGDPCEGGAECNATCNEDAENCFDPNGTPCGDGGICVDGDCLVDGVLELPLDIKPRICPNTIMRDTSAAVWAALLGSKDFDITQVRMSSLLLSRTDGVGGSLAPKNLKFKDEGTPFEGELCDCHAAGRDQITDLRMKFKTDAMVEAFLLDDEPSGSTIELIVTGQLNDGTLIFGRDCILLVR
ncbi:MAG: hypothetical protein IH899_16965, partial [Planctomycetes bacterium]|nr:hypothetical protein [Planctomycetota bacterium]